MERIQELSGFAAEIRRLSSLLKALSYSESDLRDSVQLIVSSALESIFVKNLTLLTPPGQLVLVDGLSFHLAKGSNLLIVGPSGRAHALQAKNHTQDKDYLNPEGSLFVFRMWKVFTFTSVGRVMESGNWTSRLSIALQYILLTPETIHAARNTARTTRVPVISRTVDYIQQRGLSDNKTS